jgi:hypothetical protein
MKKMNKEENAILQEIKKDIKRILELLENPKQEIKGEKPYFTGPNQPKKEYIIRDPNSPATIGQKDFLLSKEYNGNVDELTKLEASKLIDAYIKRGR